MYKQQLCSNFIAKKTGNLLPFSITNQKLSDRLTRLQ